MKNSFKRIIALVLSLIILASTAAVSFASFAAPQEDSAITTTTANEDDSEQPHPTFFKLFVSFVKEIFDFFKYIFYDVILGRPAPDVPEPSYYHPHAQLAA